MLGVSPGALSQARRQLSETLTVVIFVAAIGAALVGIGRYLLIGPTVFVTAAFAANLFIAGICLWRIRCPLAQPNSWALGAYVYFATIAMISTIVYQGHGNIVNFGILNLGPVISLQIADTFYWH